MWMNNRACRPRWRKFLWVLCCVFFFLPLLFRSFCNNGHGIAWEVHDLFVPKLPGSPLYVGSDKSSTYEKCWAFEQFTTHQPFDQWLRLTRNVLYINSIMALTWKKRRETRDNWKLLFQTEWTWGVSPKSILGRFKCQYENKSQISRNLGFPCPNFRSHTLWLRHESSECWSKRFSELCGNWRHCHSNSNWFTST
jgi:hypothetical protein